MGMTVAKALGGIANAESDFAEARRIFQPETGASRITTIAAARLADDMTEAFGEFDLIATLGNYKGARVLASFGAMAAELRRLQDENAELKRLNGAMQRELNDCTRRDADLVAKLESAKATLDSVAYDVGELPARFVSGDVPAAASLIRTLPAIRQAISNAESVLGDNL